MRYFKKLKKIYRKFKVLFKNNYYIRCYYRNKIIPKTILIESKNGTDVAGNMFYILKEITNNYSDFIVYLSIENKCIKKFDELFKKYKIKNVNFVKHNSLKYMKVLSFVNYLFNDTSFPNYFIKKTGQIYTNTWHGTPFKKMGRAVKHRTYAIGNVQRNFLMSDYLIYPNNFMKEKMINDYMLTNISNSTILYEGYPRNTVFLTKDKSENIRKKLKLNKKQVIVYMPTWRGIMTKRKNEEQADDLLEYFTQIDSLLNDNQIMFIKLHPFSKKGIDCKQFKHIKEVPEEYEIYDFLNIADTLITDYSSIFFDFANTRKKTILFTYDREEYFEDRGTYFPLEELPFPQVTSIQELISEINTDKEYDDIEFIKKYCTYDNKMATKRLCDYILKGKGKLKTEKVSNNNKENILIYSGNFAKNGLTTSLLSLLNNVNLNDRNYFVTFKQNSIKKNPLKLDVVPPEVNILPMSGRFTYSYAEILCYVMFYKFNINNNTIQRYLDRLYKRELKKRFPSNNFSHVIHYTGYEKLIIGLFQRFKCSKTIFVHSDMVLEIKTKQNQHYLTLKEAYQNYDNIAAVTKDMKKSIIEISGKDANIHIVNNSINYKGFLEKSKNKISFDADTFANVTEEKLIEILDSSSLKFINIGRFSKEKGHARLIRAFEKFVQMQNKDSFLIIIGGYGKNFKEILTQVKLSPCKEKIIIIRNISNPINILKKCDLFILSSHYEALGLVVLEADVVKVPVICTNIPGSRNFLEEYNGYLVENSEEGIYKGMLDFVDGKVKVMNVDYKKYNTNVINQFESMLGNNKMKGGKKQ